MSDYISALLLEIRQKAPGFTDHIVTSVFFGGGTPSILPEKEIVNVMECLRKEFTISEEAEITIEANPGTLTKEKLSAYRGSGFNRLSLGLQSALAHELLMLGRIHRYEDAVVSFELARKAGFDNINLDLMQGLPGQKKRELLETLSKAASLRPEHISVYSLIIEKGTKFYALYGADEEARQQGEVPQLLPTEEEERELYYETLSYLSRLRYRRYEISNYAKEGYACRHNLGYWKRREYLGLGLGSASLIGNRRFSNTKELSSYLKGDFDAYDEEALSTKSEMAETMFLGLRLSDGVSKIAFFETFGRAVNSVYPEALEKLKREGLLTETKDRVFLTDRGFDVANYAMAEFL